MKKTMIKLILLPYSWVLICWHVWWISPGGRWYGYLLLIFLREPQDKTNDVHVAGCWVLCTQCWRAHSVYLKFLGYMTANQTHVIAPQKYHLDVETRNVLCVTILWELWCAMFYSRMWRCWHVQYGVCWGVGDDWNALCWKNLRIKRMVVAVGSWVLSTRSFVVFEASTSVDSSEWFQSRHTPEIPSSWRNEDKVLQIVFFASACHLYIMLRDGTMSRGIVLLTWVIIIRIIIVITSCGHVVVLWYFYRSVMGSMG